MTQFNMNNFVNFLNNKKKATTSDNSDKPQLPKIRYFKVPLGETHIRWLPYVSEAGVPAFCVYYYDNQQVFGERRVVAPFQYGLPDPIAEYVETRRKERLSSKEFGNIMKISPKPSWYIPLAVREKESDGAYLWELNDKRFKELALATVAHPDYQEPDELILDVKSGRDIIINAKQSDKIFNGKRTTEWTPSLRGKPTALAKTKEEVEALTASIQNPVEYMKNFVKKEEAYQTLLSTALSYFSNGDRHESASELGTERGNSKTSKPSEQRNAVENALDAAFDDDDDANPF